jgi:hypothetical protein
MGLVKLLLAKLKVNTQHPCKFHSEHRSGYSCTVSTPTEFALTTDGRTVCWWDENSGQHDDITQGGPTSKWRECVLSVPRRWK